MSKHPVVEITAVGFVYVDGLLAFDLETAPDEVEPDLRSEISENVSRLVEKWGLEALTGALEFARDEIAAYEPCDQIVLTLTPLGRRLMGGEQ